MNNDKKKLEVWIEKNDEKLKESSDKLLEKIKNGERIDIKWLS